MQPRGCEGVAGQDAELGRAGAAGTGARPPATHRAPHQHSGLLSELNRAKGRAGQGSGWVLMLNRWLGSGGSPGDTGGTVTTATATDTVTTRADRAPAAVIA